MAVQKLPKEFTAMVLVITANSPRKALLVQSRKHKSWMPPGGHLETAENPMEAAIRETLEETGLDITPYLPTPLCHDENRLEVPLPKRIIEVHLSHGGRTHTHIDFLYRVEVLEALPVQRDESESSDIGWFTLSQLDELTIPVDLLPMLKQELKG